MFNKSQLALFYASLPVFFAFSYVWAQSQGSMKTGELFNHFEKETVTFDGKKIGIDSEEGSESFTFQAYVLHNWASRRDGFKEVYNLTNKTENLPLIGLRRWVEAKADPDANGYRLPTEEEWEFACMAGAISIPDIDTEKADFDGRGINGFNLMRTMPVASYPSNPYGLYDMQGNVMQWCMDTTPTNFTVVKKGGDWWSDITNLRPQARGASQESDNRTGFRLVRNAE